MRTGWDARLRSISLAKLELQVLTVNETERPLAARNPGITSVEAEHRVAQSEQSYQLAVGVVEDKESEAPAISGRDGNAPVQACVPEQEFLLAAGRYLAKDRADALGPDLRPTGKEVEQTRLMPLQAALGIFDSSCACLAMEVPIAPVELIWSSDPSASTAKPWLSSEASTRRRSASRSKRSDSVVSGSHSAERLARPSSCSREPSHFSPRQVIRRTVSCM